MKRSKDWRIRHEQVMENFLSVLNKLSSSFILKDGIALRRCYGLDRFSEDIDLDGFKQDIGPFVRRFCAAYGYSYREAKNTEVVKRYLINYGNDSKPLKVEVSYRNKKFSDQDLSKITEIRNGTLVYTIDILGVMKSIAYQGRDKLRDLYDLSFICEKYVNALSRTTKLAIASALAYRGLDHFEYMVATQEDPLIDKDRLLDKYLKMHDSLGLLVSKKNDKKTDLER